MRVVYYLFTFLFWGPIPVISTALVNLKLSKTLEGMDFIQAFLLVSIWISSVFLAIISMTSAKFNISIKKSFSARFFQMKQAPLVLFRSTLDIIRIIWACLVLGLFCIAILGVLIVVVLITVQIYNGLISPNNAIPVGVFWLLIYLISKEKL